MRELILSARFHKENSHTLESYLADGGYLMAKKALTQMSPEEIRT